MLKHFYKIKNFQFNPNQMLVNLTSFLYLQMCFLTETIEVVAEKFFSKSNGDISPIRKD